MADKPVPVLTGCTASGKTGMLLEFQHRRGGLVVVSADSRQVCKGMDIGTAKPTPEEREELPHLLIDRITPGEVYSAGRFVSEADGILAGGRDGSGLNVVAGGTILYILSLTGGLDPMPPAHAGIRTVLRSMETDTPGILHRMLSVLDPDRADSLAGRDSVRLVRALEILFQTGARPSSLLRGGDRERRTRFRTAAVAVPREELRERIWRRTRGMLAGGLLEEVRRLTEQGWDRESALGRTIGYRQVLDHFEAGAHGTLDELAEKIATDTWRLARRQLNMMGRIKDLRWIDDQDGLESFLLEEEGP